jgi:glucokinase
METIAIGIDIGGMLDAVLGLTACLVDAAGGADSVAGIGVGTPGFVDEKGIVTGRAVNLPGWEGTRLGESIARRFGRCATVTNDANAMTLAEARFGAGRGVRNLVCYTLGTGIGGGIVAKGKLYTGSNGMAGEFGHVSIDPEGVKCACGQMGCVERYASARGIVRSARELCAAENVEETPFVRMVRSSGEAATSRQVYDFVNAGDPVARRVNDVVCDRLARAVGITINMLAPDLVVLGGGVMMAGPVIVDSVRNHLPRYTLPELLAGCSVVAAQLGEEAGVIGAGALVFEEVLRFDA